MRAVYGFLLLADCIAMTIYLTVALKRLPEKIGNIDPEKNRKGKDWEVFRSNDYFFRLLKIAGSILLFYALPQIVYIIEIPDTIDDSRALSPVLIILLGTPAGAVALNLFFSRIGWANGIIEYKSRRTGRLIYLRKYFNRTTLGIGIVIAMYFSVAWGLSVSVIKTIMLFS